MIESRLDALTTLIETGLSRTVFKSENENGARHSEKEGPSIRVDHAGNNIEFSQR